MREPAFLILTALAASPQHGYAIMADLARISDGRVRPRAGTLYAALDRLRAEGLIAIDREEVAETRLRRYCRLTEQGAGRLAAQTQRMRDNAAIAAAATATGHGTAGRRVPPAIPAPWRRRPRRWYGAIRRLWTKLPDLPPRASPV